MIEIEKDRDRDDGCSSFDGSTELAEV